MAPNRPAGRFRDMTIHHNMLALALLGLATGADARPADAPMVSQAAATPTPAVAANTVGGYPATVPTLATLAGALRLTSLGTTLAGSGPYTLFAPTDAAFARLAPGSIDLLWRPENKASLAKLIGYHVVAGRITIADLKQAINAAHGPVTLTTVEGDPLTVTQIGNAMMLTDVNGNKSYIERPDIAQANGIVHCVNGVLIPKLG